MPPLSLHPKFIETALRQMAPKATFVFGVAICQRVWPVFAKGLRQNECKDRDDLESDLIAVWKSLADLAPPPSSISPAFERAIPTLEVAERDNAFFESAVTLYGFADSFDRAWPEGIVYVSRTTLGLLDTFLYSLLNMEVTAENDLIVDNHPLLVREIKRQETDISDLSKGANPETVLSIWARSKSEPLLGDY